MTMFPGAGAVIYRNEAGEPLGWDYPSEPTPHDYDQLDREDAWHEQQWERQEEEGADAAWVGKPMDLNLVEEGTVAYVDGYGNALRDIFRAAGHGGPDYSDACRAALAHLKRPGAHERLEGKAAMPEYL